MDNHGYSVMGLVTRLRMVQTTCAELPDEQRRDLLEQELQAYTRKIPSGRKESFLLELSSHFPLPEKVSEAAEAGGKEGKSCALPEDRIQEWVQEAQGWDAASKKKLRDVFSEQGLIPGVRREGENTNPDTWAKVRQALNVAPEAPISEEEISRILEVMVAFFSEVVEGSSRAWRQLDPNSQYLRDFSARNFRDLLGRLVIADEKLNAPAVVQLIQDAKLLLLSILRSMMSSGQDFSRDYLDTFSPENIKNVVSNNMFFRGEKCWQKYEELSVRLLTPEAIEHRLRTIIARNINNLLKNRQV